MHSHAGAWERKMQERGNEKNLRLPRRFAPRNDRNNVIQGVFRFKIYFKELTYYNVFKNNQRLPTDRP